MGMFTLFLFFYFLTNNLPDCLFITNICAALLHLLASWSIFLLFLLSDWCVLVCDPASARRKAWQSMSLIQLGAFVKKRSSTSKVWTMPMTSSCYQITTSFTWRHLSRSPGGVQSKFTVGWALRQMTCDITQSSRHDLYLFHGEQVTRMGECSLLTLTRAT